MEKKLDQERKKRDELIKKTVKKTHEQEDDAERRLAIELKHQMEEAETRALGKAMMNDVENNNASMDNSSWKLLNNFQGKF